jgi:hypothetical protein
MRSVDSATLTNVTTTTAFAPKSPLQGGLYFFAIVGTWNGASAQLAVLGPDGATLLTVSASFTANGGAELYLPPGNPTLVVTGTPTGLTAGLTRIPFD